MAILWPFLSIFLPTIYSSFTKLRLRQSFWCAKHTKSKYAHFLFLFCIRSMFRVLGMYNFGFQYLLPASSCQCIVKECPSNFGCIGLQKKSNTFSTLYIKKFCIYMASTNKMWISHVICISIIIIIYIGIYSLFSIIENNLGEVIWLFFIICECN